jgi:hypothetical protein
MPRLLALVLVLICITICSASKTCSVIKQWNYVMT